MTTRDLPKKWCVLELNNVEELSLMENDSFQVLLKQAGLQAKLVVDRFAIFDMDSAPSTEQLQSLNQLLIDRYSSNLEEEPVPEDIEELQLVEEHSFDDLLYQFSIPNWEGGEDSLIEFLNRNGSAVLHEPESHFLEEFEYKTNLTYVLFHDIRKPKIAVFLPDISNPFAVALVGYRIWRGELQVTVKTFSYEVLEEIAQRFQSEFPVESTENLLWKRLMSRKCSGGMYRPTDAHLVRHPESEQFLKTSANGVSAQRFKFAIEKLLDKGYLTEAEYFGASGVSNDGRITKFFMPYSKFNSQQELELWVGLGTGQVYKSLDSTDPKRIQRISTETIFAPHHDLLYYIRAYWHQNFVEASLEHVKNDWENQSHHLQIIELMVDAQFDLLSIGTATRASRDFDALLRVRNVRDQKEHIIPVEMKAPSHYYSEVKTDNRDKIDWAYVDLFTGFLMVAYHGASCEPDNIEWQSQGELKSKPIRPIVEHNYIDLVQRLKEEIEILCTEIKEP